MPKFSPCADLLVPTVSMTIVQHIHMVCITGVKNRNYHVLPTVTFPLN